MNTEIITKIKGIDRSNGRRNVQICKISKNNAGAVISETVIRTIQVLESKKIIIDKYAGQFQIEEKESQVG